MGTEAFHGDGAWTWGRGLSTVIVPSARENLTPK